MQIIYVNVIGFYELLTECILNIKYDKIFITMPIPDLIAILFISLSLSVDCFAVSLAGCVSMPCTRYLQVFRTALTFGVFQSGMPVIGWLAGRSVVDYIDSFDHWVVFALLGIIGGKMIWEALCGENENNIVSDITRGLTLFILAFATSIDALAVGLSFAFMKTNILIPVILIGVVAFGATHAGFYLGGKAGKLMETKAKIFGGLVLIAIGIRFVVSHFIAG
jgi:manganese efflux pump family protein